MDDRLSGVISSTTWSGAAMAVTGSLTLTDWLAVIGAVCAVGGLISNIVHKRAMRRIAERELELKFNVKT